MSVITNMATDISSLLPQAGGAGGGPVPNDADLSQDSGTQRRAPSAAHLAPHLAPATSVKTLAPSAAVMEGHRDGRTLGTREPDVAAFLAKNGVAELGQGTDARSPGNDGKRWHAQAATMLMSTTSYS